MESRWDTIPSRPKTHADRNVILRLTDESREVGVLMAKDQDDKGSEIELDSSATQQHGGVVARTSYLGHHRSQIQFSVTEQSRSMATRTEIDSERLEKLVRFLKECPGYVTLHEYQKAVKNTVVRNDFAG